MNRSARNNRLCRVLQQINYISSYPIDIDEKQKERALKRIISEAKNALAEDVPGTAQIGTAREAP